MPIAFRSAVVCCSVAVSALQASAQTGDRRWQRVLGTFDAATGQPIVGATVLDVNSGTHALTSATGTVSLAFLPEGWSLLRIQKIGYAEMAQLVRIAASDTVPITLLMQPVGTLAAVVTSAKPVAGSPGLRGFEERRETQIGEFIADDELRKNDNRTTSDVLRSVTGIAIQCSRRNTESCFAVSSRAGCQLTMYLDGIVMTNADLSLIHIGQLSAIEIYSGASRIPPQFNATGSACGVILFWSRI